MVCGEISTYQKELKYKIFNTNIKSVILYACEIWKTTRQITRGKHIFVNKCSGRINRQMRLQMKNYGDSLNRRQ
jgi:hypothetical protein